VVQDDVREVLDEFADRPSGTVPVVGLYVGGSIATGDSRPATSDVDLVAVTERAVGAGDARSLRRLHMQLIADRPTARLLGCVYVPRSQVDDLGTAHVTWSHQRMFRRPLSGVARAELLAHGLVLIGPPVDAVLPGIDAAQLRAAVLAELTGYWTRALGWRSLWLRDGYVDLALLTMARAHATLTEGSLITKSEALELLPGLGVAPELVEEIRRRRQGSPVVVRPGHRLRRARLAHRTVRSLVQTLTARVPRAGNPASGSSRAWRP
jgi:hypothetical protein